MPSFVYFKFKSSISQQEIPFEGSQISVNDLKNAIRLKTGIKSNDCDLVVMSSDGKDYTDIDSISAYSSVIVRRMPVLNKVRIGKTINPENFNTTDPYKLMRTQGILEKNTALMTSDMTDEQKQDFIVELGSKMYNNAPQRVYPMGPVPNHYVCNKCNIPGHWIAYCPGIADKNGKMLAARAVKRPTGIPMTKLTEVAPGTDHSFLTVDGRYVVNTNDHEALLRGKKDKRVFSKDENPDLVIAVVNKPACLLCFVCRNVLRNPVRTPCCCVALCQNCALNTIFDDCHGDFHRCPKCRVTIDVLDSLTEDNDLSDIIFQWQQKSLSDEELEARVCQKSRSQEVGVEENEEDLMDSIFDMSDNDETAIFIQDNHETVETYNHSLITDNDDEQTKQREPKDRKTDNTEEKISKQRYTDPEEKRYSMENKVNPERENRPAHSGKDAMERRHPRISENRRRSRSRSRERTERERPHRYDRRSSHCFERNVRNNQENERVQRKSDIGLKSRSRINNSRVEEVPRSRSPVWHSKSRIETKRRQPEVSVHSRLGCNYENERRNQMTVQRSFVDVDNNDYRYRRNDNKYRR